jgi:hypothetical protein
MKESASHSNAWRWLTLPIALLLAIAAGGGVFVPDLYRDNSYYVAQAVGQDLVSLVVVLPALIVTAFLSHRGSSRARLVWLGVLVYLVYTYVVAAFDNRFNSLFLVYVALLGCSLYALIGGLATTDLAGVKAGFTGKTSANAVSIYLFVLAILFYFLWLSESVPALVAGKIPQSVQDNGTPTNAIHVLDMAWILPAFAIAGVSLRRKQALGYTLAGALLTYSLLLTLAILSMVVFMMRQGQPVVAPQVVIFGALFAISLGMLVGYLRGYQSSP